MASQAQENNATAMKADTTPQDDDISAGSSATQPPPYPGVDKTKQSCETTEHPPETTVLPAAATAIISAAEGSRRPPVDEVAEHLGLAAYVYGAVDPHAGNALAGFAVGCFDIWNLQDDARVMRKKDGLEQALEGLSSARQRELRMLWTKPHLDQAHELLAAIDRRKAESLRRIRRVHDMGL